MKRMILIMFLTTISLYGLAQEKNVSKSHFKETKNGVAYEMETQMSGTVNKNSTKAHFTFTVKGETTKLNKVALTSKNELYVAIPITKETQEINVAPGHYIFKFYHQKMEEQQFEADLKAGEDKVVVLTVK